MNKEINIFDYHGKKTTCLLPDDAELLIVTEATGDEIIDVFREETMFGNSLELIERLDPNGHNRMKDCIDRIYKVDLYDERFFDAWNDSREVPDEWVFIDYHF